MCNEFSFPAYFWNTVLHVLLFLQSAELSHFCLRREYASYTYFTCDPSIIFTVLFLKAIIEKKSAKMFRLPIC